MLELPETLTLARQLNGTARGKKIRRVVAAAAPHKFAFFNGDPGGYDAFLSGQTVGESAGLGAMVEFAAGDRRVVFGDGANLRYYADVRQAPPKHQLLIEFDDSSALVCTIQMYGMIYAFKAGETDNKYYLAAGEKPSPMTDAFDETYFAALRTDGANKLSAKAFLATEQRVPGLGNGVLQDILFQAGVHPKRKIGTLTESEYGRLYTAVRLTLSDMTALGGRDTEKDLFGNPGCYRTRLSKNTAGKPCPACGAIIEKTAYMGGAVYWCPGCQPYTA